MTRYEPDEKWTRAGLGVYADTLDRHEISSMLGLQPTRVHLKGEVIGRDPQQRARKSSAWVVTTPLGSDASMTAHLAWLLDALEPRRAAVQALARSHKVLFVCGYSSGNGQGGFTLDSALLSRLASLGTPLSLDLYPPGPPDAESKSD